MIRFRNQALKFTLKNKSVLKKWIEGRIVQSKNKVGDVSFVFCTDEFLLGINKQFLNHDTLTDIITFDYCEGKEIRGEIYISIDRVKENATKFSKSFEDELHRVIIHGVLHLLGYKDKTKAKKLEMTLAEDNCLKALKR